MICLILFGTHGYQRERGILIVISQNYFKIHSIATELTTIIQKTVRVLVLSEYWLTDSSKGQCVIYKPQLHADEGVTLAG